MDATHACLPADRASPEQAFAAATDVWVAMHSMVSLRRHVPAFPWPGTIEQLVGIISALLPHVGTSR